MPLASLPATAARGDSAAHFRRRVRPHRSPLELAAEHSSQNNQSTAIGESGKPTTIEDVRRTSIKQLRVTLDETPQRLKELEEKWRARRRGVSQLVTNEASQPRLTGSSRTRGQDRLLPVGFGQRLRSSGSIANVLPSATVARVAPKSEVQTRHPPRVGTSGDVMPSVHHTRRAVSFATAPPTPPPSTPSSSCRLEPPPQKTSFVLPAGQPAPRPILAHPLPPTTFPIPIGPKSSKNTIHIRCPESRNELVISLRASARSMVITRGGMELTVGDHVVRLLEHSAWGKRERKEWEMVLALLERVKRATPRVSSSLDQKGYS